MNFLADENFPLPSIRALRQTGHNVIAIITESPGSSDIDVLSWAVREKRIILTFDRDFGTLIFHQQLPTPKGVVYFRFEPKTPIEPADYLQWLIDLNELSLEGQFTVVRRNRVRQRVLP